MAADTHAHVHENKGLIFLCVDGSPSSLHTFEWFRRHYYRSEQTVGIVHVYTLPVAEHENRLADIDNNYKHKMHDIKKKEEHLIQFYREKCSAMKVKIFSRAKHESIGHTICELAREHKPESIVMGQRGCGAVKRTIFGSVSDYVLHHSHVPMIIIPIPRK